VRRKPSFSGRLLGKLSWRKTTSIQRTVRRETRATTGNPTEYGDAGEGSCAINARSQQTGGLHRPNTPRWWTMNHP
jgi:hypothetical protein